MTDQTVHEGPTGDVPNQGMDQAAVAVDATSHLLRNVPVAIKRGQGRPQEPAATVAERLLFTYPIGALAVARNLLHSAMHDEDRSMVDYYVNVCLVLIRIKKRQLAGEA